MRQGGLMYWLPPILLGTFLISAAFAHDVEIVARAKPAVVLIINETNQGTVTGTGFLFDSNGYIATSRYIIEDANRLTVGTADGKRQPAWVVRHRSDFSAAVIKIPGADLPTLPLGNSDSVSQGQQVFVLGYPLMRSAPSSSVVQVTVTKGTMGMWQVFTDAVLDPGNTGGPVLNGSGEVVEIIASRLDLVQGQQSKWNFVTAINQFRTFAADVRPDLVAPPQSAPKLAQPPLQAPQPFVDPSHGMIWFCDHPPRCTSWRLGLTVAAFIQTYGPARVTSASVTGYEEYCWENHELSWCVTVALGSSKIIAITVIGGSFQIFPSRPNGLVPQIGDRESKVLTAMGNSELVWQRPDIGTHWLVYDGQGLAIVIDNRRGTVTGVSVFHPETARSFMAIQ